MQYRHTIINKLQQINTIHTITFHEIIVMCLPVVAFKLLDGFMYLDRNMCSNHSIIKYTHTYISHSELNTNNALFYPLQRSGCLICLRCYSHDRDASAHAYPSTYAGISVAACHSAITPPLGGIVCMYVGQIIMHLKSVLCAYVLCKSSVRMQVFI
jgi:hypothetical protein